MHVFVRERLRQWRHQLLLDGPFIDLTKSDPSAHKKMLDNRWARFQQEASIGGGKFDAFLGRPGADQYWFVTPKMPQEAALLEQILELQESLRIDYQLSFAVRKSEASGMRLGLAEVTRVADWIATTTLVGAVVVTVAQLGAELTGGQDQHDLAVWLGAAAIGLAVASLATRAIRAGLTIPGELESYEDYGNRCQILAEMFRKARNDNDNRAQWGILQDLERAAADELRRFLHVKRDARFVL